jgi:hypothetical protein
MPLMTTFTLVSSLVYPPPPSPICFKIISDVLISDYNLFELINHERALPSNLIFERGGYNRVNIKVDGLFKYSKYVFIFCDVLKETQLVRFYQDLP